MDKLDLTKKYKAYYTAKQNPEVTEIERALFLSVTGQGDPSGQAFLERIQAMYSVVYTLKFQCKKENQDFKVSKLEAQWWFDEKMFGNVSMDEAPEKIPRSVWYYRLLIRIPEFCTNQKLQNAIETVYLKKQLTLVKEVSLFEMTEGKVVQMLHVGAFANEFETLKVMKDFMTARNLQKNGLHHEIYLSDFNKTAPEKLRTILREPVK